MSEHFVAKIRVAAGDFVQSDGAPVLECYGELQTLLADRAGPEAAALFAEPLISRGNDQAAPTVSWYGDLAGDARPLDALPESERSQAEAYLAAHLRPLRNLAETEPLLRGALTLLGKQDILVVDGRPLIVNWGLMPDGNGADAWARPAHLAQTLGRFLPIEPGRAAPETPRAAAAAAPAAAPAAAAAATAAPSVPRTARPITAWAWVPLVLLLLLAGGVLAWLLIPGNRLFHPGTDIAVSEADLLSAAQAETRALRDRRAQLQAALDGAVCRADGQLILPDGKTPEGLLPPALGDPLPERADAAPDPILPSPPNRVALGDAGTLLAHIEARTVMVIAAGGGPVSAGSGLVIGPGLVVTNHHVIEPALTGGRVLVTSQALGEVRAATVEKSLGPLAEAGSDLALLRLDTADLPAFEVHVPPASLKLHAVVAAGYPGDVLETDAGFSRLSAGDLSAAPGLTVTDGIVNTEQALGPETNVLMHSAALSTGNSGGPLVDMCGRLVGVNSFVRKGAMQNRGFALGSGDLLAFLRGTDAAPAVTSDRCAPVVTRPDLAQAD